MTLSSSTVTISPGGAPQSVQATVTAGSDVTPYMFAGLIVGMGGGCTSVGTLSIDVNAAGAPTMTASDEGWSNPNPNLDQSITDRISAQILPSVPAGATVTYSWTAGPAWFSVDNGVPSPFTLDDPSDYTLAWPSGSSTDKTASGSDVLTASFNSVGWYIVQVSCTATVTNAPCSGTIRSRFAAAPMQSEQPGYRLRASGKGQPGSRASTAFRPADPRTTSRNHSA